MGHCRGWGGHGRDRGWCACYSTPTTRYAGLQCEKSYADGKTCGAACTAHGTCVNGYCECEAGWHGADCNLQGTDEVFLTRGQLHTAGLLSGRPGSKETQDAACTAPSWAQAFDRNASLMSKLVQSLPEDHPGLRCGTCAVVSNAGSLMDATHGEAIDANDCVFRMNRAPTAGFERHVGSKTTLDYVNSFPHLRQLTILPRLDTTLVHGMTVELFQADDDRQGEGGFDKYMGWVSGHVSFKAQHPDREAYVLSLPWLMRSWQAYWAYLAAWLSPLSGPGRAARPSSGWHMTRLALERCDVVNLCEYRTPTLKTSGHFSLALHLLLRQALANPCSGATCDRRFLYGLRSLPLF